MNDVIIKSMILENFRQFKGEYTLDFATDSHKMLLSLWEKMVQERRR